MPGGESRGDARARPRSLRRRAVRQRAARCGGSWSGASASTVKTFNFETSSLQTDSSTTLAPPCRPGMTRYPWSVDRAMNHRGDLADFFGEELKFAGKNGLHSVREGFVGLMVDFNEKAVGADGASRAPPPP